MTTIKETVMVRTTPGMLASAVVAALVLLVLLFAAASPARADFGIVPGSFTAGAYQDEGETIPETQAGAVPFQATTGFTLNSHDVPNVFGLPTAVPDGNLKSTVVDLPAGLVADPLATPQCSRDHVLTAATDYTFCPPSTQVGIVRVTLVAAFSGANVQLYPVYNMVPRDGDVADFAFAVVGYGATHVVGSVRTDGDYGVRTVVPNISSYTPALAVELTFWGVPAAPAHDPWRDRFCLNAAFGCNPATPGVPSGATPKAFLRNPTSCDGRQPVTRMKAQSWQQPGVWVSATASSPEVKGCEKLSFAPSLRVTPEVSRAGAPTGLNVDLHLPQATTPGVLATPQLRRAVVRLPAGMTISPSAADGLHGCSDAQSGMHSTRAPTCPDASKIGTVQIDTPLLAKPLTGSIVLGTQESNDPASGQMYRLFLIAQSRERGLTIVLPGQVAADPATGRLTATFDDNPQLPFSDLHLRFRGGPRAPLTTPQTCGSSMTQATLTSWAGQVVSTRSPMTIDQGCDQHAAFTPSLTAGVVDPTAGVSSPFVLRFSRPDGQRELGAINGSLPQGLLGTLASVPLCSAVQGAAGTCPAASRVGKVQVAAGSGPQPVWLPAAGKPEASVYLTEPYRSGDVAGMSIVVPAVAGPFDLGTVVTKVYLKLRPEDQGIDMQSEQLPRMLAGVPLNIREVVVTIDRKGFMVNPTSCDAMATYANVFSQSWAKAPITSRFQVGGCAALEMSPIITAAAGGKGNTRRYEHPALKVTIRQPAGQAHLSKTNVVLPKELNIDLKAPALKAACPRAAYAKDQCSPVATVGTVKAVTPLLREPLSGPAFLIQKKGQLPDIVMRLRNDRMSLDLIGVLDFLKDGRLITRVKGIPDAALSSFMLSIKGGKGGSLLNRHDLCARKRLTKATFKGQNGKLSRKSPVTRISGCAKAKAKSAARSREASRRAARVAGVRASAAHAAGAGASAARAGEIPKRASEGRS